MEVWGKPTQPPSKLIFPWCLSDETQKLLIPIYVRSIQEDNPNSSLSFLKGHCAGVPGHNHSVQWNTAHSYPKSNSDHKQMAGEEYRNVIIICDISPKFMYPASSSGARGFPKPDMVALGLVTHNRFLFQELGHCPLSGYKILAPGTSCGKKVHRSTMCSLKKSSSLLYFSPITII